MTAPLLGSAGLESWLKIVGEKAGPQYETMMRAAILGARNDGLEEAAAYFDQLASAAESKAARLSGPGAVALMLNQETMKKYARNIRARKATPPAPCCKLDTDGDGDCPIHPKVSR